MSSTPNYRLAARRAAARAGIDPNIFERQIGAESGFNPGAHSPAGAEGIAQFIPSTAKAYGVNLHDGRVSDDLAGAARLMAEALRKTGSYTKALSVYNSGRPDGYKRFGETAAYVQKILHGHDPGGGGSISVQGHEASVPGHDVTRSTFDEAGYDKARRMAIVGELLAKHNPNSLLLKTGVAGGEMPNRADFQGTETVHIPGSGGAHATVSDPKGHQTAAALKELFWQGPGGIDVKNGHLEPQGFVDGHEDHVHVGTLSDAARAQVHALARHYGLKATSTGGGVHVSGSYHYQKTPEGKSGAIDYAGSPDAMARFAHAVANLFQVKR